MPLPISSRPTGSRVAEVRVRSGNMVDSVQMVYALVDNSTVVGPLHGGSGGRLNSFRLDADEYIIGLSGRYGEIWTRCASSPTSAHPRRTEGAEGRTDLRVDVPSGYLVIGFAGRAGQYVDASG